MVVLLVGLVLYVVLAPETWWKPVYVRLEMESTPVAQVSPIQNPEQTVTMEATPTAPISPEQLVSLSPAESGNGIMYKLDTKVVNLADPGGLRYLQTVIVLEFHPMLASYFAKEENTGNEDDEEVGCEKFLASIDARRPVIDDIIMTILSDKTYSEIATVKGKTALKQELMDAINTALGYQGVINIYFTEFVVQ